jgi:hypothetical protein
MLDNDDDGHWYLVPETESEAFGEYVYGDGPYPESVIQLGGHPNNVTFEAPMEFRKPMVSE